MIIITVIILCLKIHSTAAFSHTFIPSSKVSHYRTSVKDLKAESDPSSKSPQSSVVVVGGGWGGWGAAKRLCEYYKGSDTKVTLIDALPDPTGATPYKSPNGKPVEAGTR